MCESMRVTPTLQEGMQTRDKSESGSSISRLSIRCSDSQGKEAGEIADATREAGEDEGLVTREKEKRELLVLLPFVCTGKRDCIPTFPLSLSLPPFLA